MNTKIQTPQTQTPAKTQTFSSDLINFIKGRFGSIPIIAEKHGETLCVRLAQRVDDDAFRRYIEVAKSLGMRFTDSKMWCAHAETIKEKMNNVVGKYYRSFYYFRLPSYDSYETLRRISCYTVEKWKQENGRLRREEVEICLHSCDGDECRIPRGLAPAVARAFGWNLPLFATNLRPPSEEHLNGLRGYQIEVFKSVFEQLRQSGAAVVQMATGAGKTHLAGHIAKWLSDQGYTVFTVAMQKDLAIQLKEHAQRVGAKNVIAVTTQYLYRRLLMNGENGDENGIDEESKEVLEYADDYSDLDDETLMRLFKQKNVAVIMDEVHHVPARTVKKVMIEAGDGWALRIGLSATPWRSDGRDLEIYAYAGTVVEPRISSSYLIKNGYAVPVEIRVVEAPYCEEVEECEGERGAAAYMCVRKALVECEERNRFIVELAVKVEKPILIITPLVKHAEKLYRLAKAAGLKAALVTGVVKAEKRKEIYDALRRGEIEVLIATTLADEGLDLPPLRTLIIAFGGKSKTRTLQRIGRLVRPYEGKKIAVAYELKEDCPYIADHLEMRLKLYRTEPHWRIVFVDSTE
ncbi:MAG: DEAD/DEAH box helicase [Pyrobaculum sp.]|jgi:superfamily II DNA or RNA helicase